MTKIFHRKSTTAGLPPGSLVHVGQRKLDKTRISVIDYSPTRFLEKELKTVEEAFPFRDTSSVTWINIDGVHEADVIRKIGEHFSIHPLVLEDIMDTTQRPKMEDFGRYIFLVIRQARPDPRKGEDRFEQTSLVVGKNLVISFQESAGDVFDSVRDRIRHGKGRIRKMGADYLAYALLDAVIDGYFLALEQQGEEIENLEDELLAKPEPATMHHIHRLKQDMIFMRKSIWPLRDVVNGLYRLEGKLFKPTTTVFLKDIYDHTVQAMDTVDTYRDMLSGMLDIYMSSVSNRMNEVMKVLTIIATIFIPLTFIVGIYGMNFKFMPELEWRWGYYGVLGIMVVVAVVMVFFFKKRKWM
jgi:magnesium transporter